MSGKGPITIQNTGTRRVIIGPPPRSSKKAPKCIAFGTKDDHKVPDGERLVDVRKLDDEMSNRLRGNNGRAFRNVAEKLGLLAQGL